MTPQFRPVADRAVLAEFADTASPDAEQAVHSLDRALAADPFPGFDEAIPAFTSILVTFDPLATSHAEVTAHLARLAARPSPAPAPGPIREIPVCYDAPYAPDLAEVARQTGQPPDAVIDAHLAATFHIVMYGFAPGYAYLAGLPETLRLARKPVPRRDVPAGSVIIAGGQCLVTTLTMPTGWWVIGRSPLSILTADPAHPVRFDVGDRIRFRRIPADELGAAHG